MKGIIITLLLFVTTTVYGGKPEFALIESEQDVRRMVASVENTADSFAKTYGFKV